MLLQYPSSLMGHMAATLQRLAMSAPKDPSGQTSSMCSCSTSYLIGPMGASLQKLAMSAPEYPSVSRQISSMCSCSSLDT